MQYRGVIQIVSGGLLTGGVMYLALRESIFAAHDVVLERFVRRDESVGLLA